jgi:branched-chain amino acid transport system substrate-binding protein
LGDPPVLTAIKQLPPGLNTAYRYNRNYPANPANTAYAEGFAKIAGHESTNWGWQNYLAMSFLAEALKRTGGKSDGAGLAAAMKGMKLKSGFAVDGEITMRDADHTIIGYPVAWGRTVPKAPYVEDFAPVQWAKILEHEAQWKKSKGYA